MAFATHSPLLFPDQSFELGVSCVSAVTLPVASYYCTPTSEYMAKTERLNIRTTKYLKQKVEAIAKERDVTVSELINDYIKRLPNPKTE